MVQWWVLAHSLFMSSSSSNRGQLASWKGHGVGDFAGGGVLIRFPCSKPPNPAQNLPLQAPTDVVLPFSFRNIEIVEHPLTIYTYHDKFLHFLPISHLTIISCPQVLYIASIYGFTFAFCTSSYFGVMRNFQLFFELPGGWSTYP